jgi:hypothetical protein
MAAITVTAADVGLVRAEENGLLTGPVNEAIDAGEYVVQDPTTGHLELGDASALSTATHGGVAVATVAAGQYLTAVRDGLVDLGDALDGLNHGDAVFLSNTAGGLDDATGTVTKRIGFVEGVFANGATADKLLRVVPEAAFTP